MPSEEWNTKGDFYLARSEFEQAIKCFNTAIQIDPLDHEAYNEKGNAFLGLKNFDEAAVAFKKAYEINPNFLSALSNIGVALSNSNKHEEAVVYYNKLISSENRTYLVAALSNKGCSLNDLKRYEEALKCLEQARTIDPNFFPAYDTTFITLSRLEKHEECLKFLDKALTMIPNQTYKNRILCYKGEALFKLNRFEEALAMFDSAIKNDNRYGDAYYGKIESLMRLLRFDEAARIKHFAYSPGNCYFINAQTKIGFVNPIEKN